MSNAVLQVRGILDKEEVLFAKNDNYLFGVHVVVGLPSTLAELITEPNAHELFRALRIIAVDEADACFQVCPVWPCRHSWWCASTWVFGSGGCARQ